MTIIFSKINLRSDIHEAERAYKRLEFHSEGRKTKATQKDIERLAAKT
jgi:hypothetical protein